MTLLDGLVLGIIEGITEFLPISSTGHLILAGKLLGIPDSDFYKTFEIAIQLGAILSVVVLYWRSFLDLEIVKRLVVAFIPTGIIGLLLHGVAKKYLLGNEFVVLGALFLGGIVLIVFERFYRHGDETVQSVHAITYKQAAFMGFFQSLAIVPGVSRSAATIVGGLLTSGMSRITIVEFSFLLAVPTMFAATGLDVIKSASLFSNVNLGILSVGFITSFLVALFGIKFLLDYVRKNSFTAFGIYRIVIALLFFLFLL